MTIRPWMSLAIILMAVVTSGCLRLERERPEKRHYLIEAARQDRQRPSATTGVVYVRRFDVSPAFEDPAFVYRIGDTAWEADYYRDFFVSPDAMLTGQVARWLDDAGLFSRVLTRGSQIPPDYLIEGNIVSLYGDYREPGRPEAVLEIQLLLLHDDDAESRIVYQGDYAAREPLVENTAEALVTAWEQALTGILRDAEREMRSALNGNSAGAP